MSHDSDAVVIGAGIIGAAIALELARAGKRVVVLDKLPAAGYGSTSNSCAIIRTYYSTLDGTALAYDGYHYWRDWASYLGADDEAGHAGFVQCGTLTMKVAQNAGLQSAMAMADELGIPYQELDEAGLRERLPAVNLDTYYPAKRPEDSGFGEGTGGAVDGAVFWPHSGYITDPQLATHNLQRAAEAVGAQFRFNTAVAEILKDEERVRGVRTADGQTWHAPVVVNVAGPHSAIVNQMAGVADSMKIKTRALRHEVPHVPAPTGFRASDGAPVTSDSDIQTYSRPASGDQILIGSEDPDCDPQEFVDPDNFDRELSEQARVQTMRLAQRLTGLGIPNRIGGVVDLYDVSDDWIPVYDKTDLPGFYVAIGTSGNQFKNAPVVGKLMCALIDACESGHDHDEDPVRYRLAYLDREISLGFYSRNREVNPDSSFSVLG